MRDLSLAIPLGLGNRKTKSGSTYRLNVAIIVSMAVLSLAYLFMVNSMGTKGYDIKKLEKEVRILTDQQKTLQMQASDLQSINRIQDEAKTLNFVEATNVTYLKESDFALR